MADATPPPDFCPYVGLQPFRVKDREYFFGREKEERIISANLFAAPLTVLYGPSAVGKSSVLQAGVVSRLVSEPRTAVAYFAAWQGDAYMSDLKAECRRALVTTHGSPMKMDDGLRLDEWLGAAFTEFRGTLLLMLDQFEEYLLYHREEDGHAFDAELARIVNRPEVPVNVLIGLRDDSLSKLNRFSKRIPNLLGNTLQLKRLTPEAARRAITGPIERYNAQFPNARPTRIDESLVGEIIADVQIGKIAPSASGGLGGVRAGEDIGLIETAFLQLVLTELWREASTRSGDRVLDSSILKSLGGADAIVRRHVDREMTKLSDDGREIAARLFQHLVTPSGAKYALVTGDLVDLAERPTEQVLPVLKALADARLLRRIESSDRYEIFHDAFAEALLDWRKDYIQQKAQRDAALAAEQRRAAERAAERQRRRRQALIGASLMVVIGIVIYVYLERRDRLALERNNDQLKYSLEIATANAEQAEQISAAARTAQLQAEASQRAAVEGIAAERLKLEVERADFAGNKTKARDLLAQQQAASERASQAEQESTRLGEQAKAQINAAAQTQTKIDDLSKSAAQKGYDVASVGSPVTMGGPPNPAGGTGATGGGGTGGGTPGGGETPIVPVVRGNYKAPFVDAMNAKNAKQWAVAKKALEAAIYQKNVDSGEKVIITGAGNIEPYSPHFYLGLALKNLSDCPGALKEFALSEQSNAIQRDSLYKTLVQSRQACGGK